MLTRSGLLALLCATALLAGAACREDVRPPPALPPVPAPSAAPDTPATPAASAAAAPCDATTQGPAGMCKR